MKKIKIFIVIFSALFYNFSEAQIIKQTSYRFEGKIESALVSTYNVCILTLYEDNAYKLVFQSYGTKKLARKNIIREIKIEEGVWSIKDSLLTLLRKQDKQKLIFNIKNEDKIRVVTEEGEILDAVWKKINR